MNVLLILVLIPILSQGKSQTITNDIKQSNDSNNLTIINDDDSTLRSLIEEPLTESTTIPREEEKNSTVYSQQEDQESSETIVYNRFDPSNKETVSSEEEEPKGPEHEIPRSEHEEPRDVPTKPEYTPGKWAKPPKGREVNLDFVPTKLYAQVRKTHTLRRLPRRKAIENAESEEERENAARLREVVRNSKVNTVYTEEGYEDSAYDHAGHVRDADFHEDYDKKLREHLNEKAKLGNVDEDEEGNETKDGGFKKVRPDNFNDYGRGSNIDGNSVNPRLIVEEGIDKLQEDVEREAEDMEKGIEVSELEKVESTTNREILGSENVQKRRRNRARRPPFRDINNNMNSDTQEIGESQNIKNSTALPFNEDVKFEGTTMRNSQDSAKLYEINEDSNEQVTTVNYGQLLWDYVKKLNQAKITELTTSAPNNYVKNLNQAKITESTTLTPKNLMTYSGYEETTSLPIIESVALSPVIGQTSIDPESLKTIETQLTSSSKEDWQPIVPNAPQTPTIPFSEFYDQPNHFSDTQKNLDSYEESDKNFDSFFDPVKINRKPRYKIAIRHKPKIQLKPDKELPLTQESKHKKGNSLPLNENYMKVLKYLKNENSRQNLKRNKFLADKNLEVSTRMRPPRREANDYYFPRGQLGATQSDWEPVQRHRSPKRDDRKKIQSGLSPRNEIAWYLGPSDYVNRGDRTVLGSIGSNAKTRVKRFYGDESGVKGPRGNNAASNRGELAGKNLERNCSQKVTRLVEVGPVPDTSAAKRLAAKKSRFNNETARPEESRGFERESRSGEEGIVDLGSVECDGEMNLFNGREGYSADLNERGRIIDRRDVGERGTLSDETIEMIKDRNNRSRTHEELLKEAPDVAEEVIEKEINNRFNNNKEEDEEGNVEVDVPEFDYIEELPEEVTDETTIATAPDLDSDKYPFYDNEQLPSPSALKYAINPERLPKKSYGAMEFYNMRDSYKHCEEVEPKLEVLPEKEEPVPDKGPKENVPRLRGLGDKLDCFKAKYFDENPFDNPLFLEKEVEDPVPPEDIDSKHFASRIMMFPKENDDYVIQRSSKRPENHRQPRRHNQPPVRFQKRRRIRYETRSRPRIRKVQLVKHLKIPGKSQKFGKRPVTAASETSNFYTPYQHQVYEDVMGTIKNMANSYRDGEVTTVPTSEEVTVVDDIDEEIRNSSMEKIKVNSSRETEKKVEGMTIDKNSSKDANIEGLTPPKNNRYRNNYKRVRIPQKGMMIQRMPKPVRAMKFRRRIRIYKRDLKDKLNSSYEEGILGDSVESTERKDSIEKFFNSRNKSDYFDSGEDDRKVNFNLKDSGEIFINSRDMKIENKSDQFDSEKNNHTERNPEILTNKNDTMIKIDKILLKDNSSIHTLRTNETERKVPKIAILNNNDTGQKVYTIRDRIRYSRAKGDRGPRKIDNETETEEDNRRREPRYNYIRRTTAIPTTSENSLSNSTEKYTEKMITKKNVELNNNESKENRNDSTSETTDGSKIRLTERKNGHSNKSEGLESKRELIPKEEANGTRKGYAVHENVNEGDVAVQNAPPFDLFDLKTFLESDPPGYTELSSDDFKKSPSNSPSVNQKTNSSNETESEKENEKPRTFYPSYFESSEKASKESSEENPPSKESESDEKTFFRYEGRPSSPAENYEDDKFSDLGPRVNKPAFFHPPFSFSNYRASNSKESSAGSEESDEETDDYVFPWYRDKKDERKRKRRRFSKSEYEYPWERRERLAREEKMRDGRRKRLFDEEDSVGAFSTLDRRSPRGRYRYWTRRNSDEGVSDSTTGETRPVIKYSSRYNSKNTKLPVEDKSRSVEEISMSIKKALEDSVEKDNSEQRISNKTEVIKENENVSLGKNSSMVDSEKNLGESLNSSNKSIESVEKLNKRRRRPLKLLTKVKTTESPASVKSNDNRSRRRQKIVPTASTETAIPISTTPASRTLRRRNQRISKNLKQNATEDSSKINSNLNDTKEILNETRKVEQRSRKRRPNAIANESVKKNVSSKDSKIDEGSVIKINEDNVDKDKLNNDRIEGNEEAGRTSEFKSDESFDFKDDRIEAMSDFDVTDNNPDDEFEFGSILKTGENFLPPGRAVKLSQQESREIVSSVSWKSENYDF